MGRPRARQNLPLLDAGWRYLIIDGYVDEPAALGVPPYISPHVRSLAGGLSAGGAKEEEIGYMTVDGWRGLRGMGREISSLPRLEAVICIKGCIVPGKYLRGEPISDRELVEMSLSLTNTPLIICGPASSGLSIDGAQVIDGDPGVLGRAISAEGSLRSRNATGEEWNTHLIDGAFIVRKHPDFPSPLIVELETARGCVRYISGGCSFCSEPGKGPIRFREPQQIKNEVLRLSSMGVENIRIGGQSDLISYMSSDAGRDECPRPDPHSLSEMMIGVREALYKGRGVGSALGRGLRKGIDCGIIHTDNANPAIISTHPEESEKVLVSIVKNTTPGTVLALGLESSDPVVKHRNNLNSTPEETIFAIELMNRIGGKRGENGLPHLLPGLNFLGGLPGQTPESFHLDLELLKAIYDRGLMLRRINIRAAIYPRANGGYHTNWKDGKVRGAFNRFKREVREKWDLPFMKRLLPIGTIMKGVFMETSAGRTSFGRQIGSYPLLVGVPHTVEEGSFADVIMTDMGARSVTGVTVPIRICSMSLGDLQAVPGIGRKRAASIVRSRPGTIDELIDRIPDLAWLREHIMIEDREQYDN